MARESRKTARTMAIRVDTPIRVNIQGAAITAQVSIARASSALLANIATTGAPGRPCHPVFKNLARGKQLPPGIAKKLDGRLAGRLPHYDGYEWQQAGTDLILVALATGLIYEILDGAFD